MKTLNRLFILLAISAAFVGCKDRTTSKRSAIQTKEIIFTKDGELTFYDSIGNSKQKLDIELAQTDYEQETGLMYRKKMKANRGMLFVYDKEQPHPNFYMKNTYIPLDLVYIDANHRIVDFNRNAQPLDETLISSAVKSKYVLEINAGMIDKWNLQIGDSLTINKN